MSSPSPLPGPDPASTPAGGVPAAPRGRRRDHLLTGALGLILAPACLILAGLAAQQSARGNAVLTVLYLALLFAVCMAAHGVFAVRSSVGPLVAGLTALVLQLAVLGVPERVLSLPYGWVQALIPTGMVLVVAAVLLGGSWGMRRARRRGRGEARLSFRLSQSDKEMGVTPSAPPSRRRDHIGSLVLTVPSMLVAITLLHREYTGVAHPPAGSPSWGLLAAGLLMLLAAAGSARSSLGLRATGPLLVLLGLPAILSLRVPFYTRVIRLLPGDPTAITLVGTGLILSALGLGVHLARRDGRLSELAALHPSGPGS